MCAAVLTCPVQPRAQQCPHAIEQTEQGRETDRRRGQVLGNWATMAIGGQAGITLVDFNAFMFGLTLLYLASPVRK